MIFITGANGLVGSFIVRRLLADNASLRCLKRSNSDLSLLSDVKHKIEWVDGDLLDVASLEKYLEGIDTVIHAAAIISFSSRKYESMFKINVEGTANIINAALLKDVRNFLFISSIASLGRSKKNNLIDESVVWEQSDENSYYAQTKYLAELEVWRGAEEGLPVVILNPSIVLGPGNFKKSSARLFAYVFKQGLFYPRGDINYVDARDLADIAVQLLQKNIVNERFIVNGGRTSYKIFFELAAQKFGKRPPIIAAGPWLLKLAWRWASFSSWIKRTEPMLTKETAAASGKSYKYENQKIKNLLNFEFRILTDTISWATTALKKNG